MQKYLLLCIFILINVSTFAQTISNERKNAINIYIRGDIEDVEYLKQKINFVNYVRDSKDAQVLVLFTSRDAGNGGEEFSIFLEGVDKFKNRNDTLTFYTSADETDDGIRQMQIKYLKIGLTQYVAHSPMIKDLSVDYTKNLDPIIHEDKWNSWVFSVNSSLQISGESSYQNYSLRSSAQANRITENWKIEFNAENYYTKSLYILTNDTIFSSRNSYGFDNLVAKTLGEHWAIGGKAQYGKSTYRNQNLYASIKPTVEYDIFPYANSNVIQWRFQYSAGPSLFKYIDTTIYNKTQELIFAQYLASAFEISKNWGSISSSVEYSSYFHDLSKYKIGIGLYFNVRLFTGFSVFAYGDYSIIHDQLYLPKEDLSIEEILLRQQQISTNHSYWVYFGFSYTFGSIYNNVVNPRFNDI